MMMKTYKYVFIIMKILQNILSGLQLLVEFFFFLPIPLIDNSIPNPEMVPDLSRLPEIIQIENDLYPEAGAFLSTADGFIYITCSMNQVATIPLSSPYTWG